MLKVYDPNVTVTKDTIYLELINNPYDDRLLIRVTDSECFPINGGNILYLMPNGKIKRITGIWPNVGVSLDAKDCDKISLQIDRS